MSDTIGALLAEHQAHGEWHQVGPCVYCKCGRRLYQGRVPGAKDCDGEHDWDYDFGQGFYYLCRRCGFKEWTE